MLNCFLKCLYHLTMLSIMEVSPIVFPLGLPAKHILIKRTNLLEDYLR